MEEVDGTYYVELWMLGELRWMKNYKRKGNAVRSYNKHVKLIQ